LTVLWKGGKKWKSEGYGKKGLGGLEKVISKIKKVKG